MEYRPFAEVVNGSGLRAVFVRGVPSPWGQAAKAIFEVKKIPYVAAAWIPGAANEEIASWGGIDSAPIVVWEKERPVHSWIDILNLAERIAPTPSLIPADPGQRALMFGLANEICGELGIGWNRRIQAFAPALKSSDPGEGMLRMGRKYRCMDAHDAARAGERVAGSLKLLDRQLASQYARGVRFFAGDALSALDLYWVTFMNLLDPLPASKCPMPEQIRPGFKASDPAIVAALSPMLVEHRDRIFEQYFKSPMEL